MITVGISHAGYSTAKLKVIAGHTLENGVLKSKTVRIFSRNSGAPLKQIKSDENGHYKAYVPYDSSYLIAGIDKSKIFNAVVQDNVVPK